eukprot:577367-Amphidinium_carterae.1
MEGKSEWSTRKLLCLLSRVHEAYKRASRSYKYQVGIGSPLDEFSPLLFGYGREPDVVLECLDLPLSRQRLDTLIGSKFTPNHLPHVES